MLRYAPKAPRGAIKSIRRTQAERSALTRQQLFNVTLELLVEQGFGSLRLAEIAASASVSKGALQHHFLSKNDLVVAAAAFAMDKAIEHELQLVAAARESADPILAIINAQREYFLSTWSVIEWELMVAARSSAELSEPLRSITAAYRTARDIAWTELLLARGLTREQAVVVLEMTVSLWRGLVWRHLRDRGHLEELVARSGVLATKWRRMLQLELDASGESA